MKKSVLLGIIGLAAGMATSYGQGFITLDNYDSNGSQAAQLVTYGAGVPANGISGAVGSGGLTSAWTAGLYWAAGTTGLSQGAGNGLPDATLALGTGPNSTVPFQLQNAFGTLGAFASIGSWNSGSTLNTTLTLEIVVYPTSAGSYAAASFRGHSAAFSMATVTASSSTQALVNDAAGFGPFTVASVPEPTTLALAGLGGLASLVAFRRKQV